MITKLPLITVIALAIGGLSLARVLAQETIFDPRKPITIADDAPQNPLQQPADAQQGDKEKTAHTLRAPANDIGPPRAPANDIGPARAPAKDNRPARAPANDIGPARAPANDLGGPAVKPQTRTGANARADMGLSFDHAAQGPLVVSSIGPNGHFANLGLQRGDTVVASGDHRFNTQADFYAWLGTVQAGRRVPLTITRGGRQQMLYWVPSDRFVQQYAQFVPAAAAPPAGPAPPIAMLGIVLDTKADDAVIVADVQPNSPAQRTGVRPGDIIAGVDGTPVLNPDEFHDVIAQLPLGKPIDLAITRTTHVQVAPAAQQFQTGQQQGTPAAPAPPTPPAVAPAPVRTVPAAPQEYRRGIFRRR